MSFVEIYTKTSLPPQRHIPASPYILCVYILFYKTQEAYVNKRISKSISKSFVLTVQYRSRRLITQFHNNYHKKKIENRRKKINFHCNNCKKNKKFKSKF